MIVPIIAIPMATTVSPSGSMIIPIIATMPVAVTVVMVMATIMSS
jgi:hypothetical protein